MIRSAVRLEHQLLRGLGFVLIILVTAGAWAFGSLSVAQAAASPGISLASLPDNAASVSAYDYGDDFACPLPVPSDDERSSRLDAESSWVRRAFSGLEVLTYTPRATHSLDDLSRAAGAADRNGLTAAGRAAQKHGNRPGSSFPLSPDRTASGYNQFGQNLVDDLLTAPNTATQRWVHPQLGQVTDFWGPNYGVRFGPNGEFVGFLDP